MLLAALFFSFFLLSRADLSALRRPAYAARLAAPSVDSDNIRGLIPGFPVNINSATAKRIVDKRHELGGFASVEQLTEVRWVGKVKLGRIRDLVTVE